jgi:DUF1365 family protein
VATAAATAPRRSALYLGSVMHARFDELARRAFRYPVYVAAIDLGELAALDRGLALFSHGGRNLFALHDRDYEGGAVGLLAAQRDLLAANGLPAPHATRLVTHLRVWGYVFNPVSFFLHYDAAGALSSVVAEVNNTYGGRRRYVLGPEQRIDERSEEMGGGGTAGSAGGAGGKAPRGIDERSEEMGGGGTAGSAGRTGAKAPRGIDPRGDAHGRVGFRHVRELFVSPFLHGPAIYELWFDAPLDGERLAITMHVRRPSGQQIFVARLAGSRRPLTDRALLAAAVRYPLMTAQVIGLIHLEAWKLRLRGVPYVRPGPEHAPREGAPRGPAPRMK